MSGKKGKDKSKVTVSVSYSLVVRDKSGKVIQEVKKPAKSFVRYFMDLLKALMTSGVATVTDINGATKSIHMYYYDASNYFEKMDIRGGDGESRYGIVVGNGTTTPSPADNKLASQIPHGDADGQLHYKDTTVGDVVVNGNEVSFEITRDFLNNGSVSVDVNEIGLQAYIRSYEEGSVQDVYVMLIRDVLGSTVSVPAGATLTVKYKIKVTT